MESDAGAFMRIAIGVFFLLFGAGLAYMLYRLATTFSAAADMIEDVNKEVVPILSRVQTTLDEVNSELGKIDELTGTVVAVADKLESTTSAVQSAVSVPLKKLGGLAAGITRGVSSFFESRRGGTDG